jgi:hypothetical protein
LAVSLLIKCLRWVLLLDLVVWALRVKRKNNETLLQGLLVSFLATLSMGLYSMAMVKAL